MDLPESVESSLHHQPSLSSIRSATSSQSSTKRDHLAISNPRSAVSPKVDTSFGTNQPGGYGKGELGSIGKRTGSIWKGKGAEKAALSLLSNDSQWKKYQTQIDRSLQSFESIKEWADFISFLSKLLKTIQTFPGFNEIPRKLLIAKRLAQCLTPALPSGVHQRALDVYGHILSVIGLEGLKRDLLIWSSGLFPFFQYASTSAKPMLLNIYEVHYVPLKNALLPAIKAFLLALLPGLEEEAGEAFEKVMYLMDIVSSTVSPPIFFQNLWMILISTPGARTNVLCYLGRRLPKFGKGEDITPIVGSDIGLMIRAFAAALEDDNLLVQRGTLDLLVTGLRLDGAASSDFSTETDRKILMSSALTVVMRRDLSLSRRLYGWLLGPEGSSDEQVAYLREWSLDVLKNTLKENMNDVSSSLSEPQRPYRIFISLLDKWEIGYPLTDVLILDALRSLKESNGDDHEIVSDRLMTGSTLYETVDPYLVWRGLFWGLLNEFESPDLVCDSLDLIAFILRSFSKQEEEIQTTHLPIIIVTLVELLHRVFFALSESLMTDIQKTKITGALDLVRQILPQIPLEVFLHLPSASVSSGDPGITPLESATAYYSSSTDLQPPSEITSSSFTGTELFKRPFQKLLALSRRSLSNSLQGNNQIEDMTCGVLEILKDWIDLGGQVGLEGDIGTIEWDRDAWFNEVREQANQTASFDTLEIMIRVSLGLGRVPYMQPPLKTNSRLVMSALMNNVLRFMTSSTQLYHIPAVHLMWELHHASSFKHIDAILFQNMLSTSIEKRLDAIHAFGVLWRLSEDSDLSNHALDGPIFIILDTLNASNVSLRRAGETWLRCDLKSYTRMLDPIMCILLDPSICRTTTTFTFSGKEVQGSRYDRPIDHARLNYVLESLASLSRFGGQALNRVIRATPISQGSERLRERATKAKIFHAEASFMDVLVELLLQFVQSEPSKALSSSLEPANGLLQLNALEIIQSILSRGDISAISHKTTETVIVAKLLYCIHEAKLDIQNQLLHVLQNIISSAASSTQHKKKISVQGLPSSGNSDFSKTSAYLSDEKPSVERNSLSISDNLSPLLLQMLVKGVSVKSNRLVLQHWVDFILMTAPQLQGHLRPLLYPLGDCLIKELYLLAESIRDVVVSEDINHSTVHNAAGSEIVMLLNALEKVVSLAAPAGSVPVSLSPNLDKRQTEVTTGLFGYVSNVFTESDLARPSTPEGGAVPKSAGLRCLDDAVSLLHTLWTASSSPILTTSTAAAAGMNHLYNRVQDRTRKALEQFYRLQPSSVVRILASCWASNQNPNCYSFEILDTLASSAQTAVSIMCQLLTRRTNTLGKGNLTEEENDTIVYGFLEAYLSRLEGPIAVQVWGTFFAMTKDVLVGASTTASKIQVFFSFKCLTALAEKVATTSALEDRRMRRDLQDTYSKLLDATAAWALRSFDGQFSVRRRARDVSNGMVSPALPGTPLEEKPAVFNTQTEVSYIAIADFMSRKTVPNLRSFLADSDKVLAACSTLCQQVVAPALRVRTKSLDVDPTALSILVGITRIPNSIKVWRALVTEAFMNDSRFFNGSPSSGARWKPLVCSLVDFEKERFTELVSRAVAAPSANIFSNRDSEMLLRSLNIRRISFVLFAAEKNHFLNQLPAIQESLVEILRMTGLSPTVRAEVYLCLRILICRIAARDLTNLWPIILTELLRVFEQLMEELPPNNSELLLEILGACKFLDLLLVIQSEDFQIHQWAFVRDTPLSLDTDEGDISGSLMDHLAELIRDSPHFSKNDGKLHPPESGDDVLESSHSTSTTAFRRPRLSHLKKISSISELEPFFAHASSAAYEALYSARDVDWTVVDDGLEAELFEGSEKF
ncbi:Dopey and related predicted leucine zipper transcription factors [Phaffia rhodozyma]|uniref:Dopey and related predicted leucine zipper transcription factors n=1 Tax=Phaffia rhodozyma TaxID=264483 RepID=A0A0F7SS94_PHARH|nr:Dopey and related predicted leucine zipper transcription factors [Phaffia rhodozyma]